MKSLEIHVLYSPEDATLAENSGLPTVHPTAPELCGACGNEVGCVGSKFIPLGLVLDHKAESMLCMSCLSTVNKCLN